MFNTAKAVALSLVFGVGVIGCAVQDERYFGRPHLFSPGTAPYQQLRAEGFDLLKSTPVLPSTTYDRAIFRRRPPNPFAFKGGHGLGRRATEIAP